MNIRVLLDFGILLFLVTHSSLGKLNIPILSSCLIFRAKSEEMTWQPCITRADMRQKAYARNLLPRVLPNTKGTLTILFHFSRPKAFISIIFLKADIFC